MDGVYKFDDEVEGISTYTSDPLPEHFNFLRLRPDATCQMRISPIMKCTSVKRQLTYCTAHDAFDEYLQIGERCARDCPNNFTTCIIDLYTSEFLRKSYSNDIQNFNATHKRVHEFLGILESVDCMHWEWTNCPKGWHEQFARGVTGSNNDFDVLNYSSLFDDLIDDIAHVALFEGARDEKHDIFKRRKESARKDLE
ncbi:putative nuclease HARBI1 [Tanacetum coccineum]